MISTSEYQFDLDSASVNIGTLRSISHQVQCLNSQQLYNIECQKLINSRVMYIKRLRSINM